MISIVWMAILAPRVAECFIKLKGQLIEYVPFLRDMEMSKIR
jgi:hypothetical protein